MSINTTEDFSKMDDFHSAKSNFSGSAMSLESLSSVVTDPQELLQKIASLHDKRYDATYQLTQCRYRFSEIEKQEMDLMKDSTIEQSKLQKGYVSDSDTNNEVSSLAKRAAERLGLMKFELNQIDTEVNGEQEKLMELEEQIEKLDERIVKCDNESDKSGLESQMSILEQQREQQSKVYEDLEFKQLEMQSKFEEESEELKRNIIEAQRQYLLTTRDRENRKLILDEQQLRLMKSTRKQMDRLESERNYCNQQIAYFQTVVRNCTSQIEKLSRRLEQLHGSDLFNKIQFQSYSARQTRSGSIDTALLNYNDPNSEDASVYYHLTDFSTGQIAKAASLSTSSQTGDDDSHQMELNHLNSQLSSINNDILNNSGITMVNNLSLDHQLQSLTEMVNSCHSNSVNNTSNDAATDNVDISNNYNGEDENHGYSMRNRVPSVLSLTDSEGSSIVQTGPIEIANNCGKQPMAVHFDNSSVGDSCTSTQSPPSNEHMIKCSHSDINSDNSSLLNSTETDSIKVTAILRRNKNKQRNNCNKSDVSSRSKQSRPLTCFLPKIHSDFNLRQHIESCGHDLSVCGAPQLVSLDSSTCQGYLWKMAGQKNLFGTKAWNKRWFYFDHTNKQLTYYNSQNKSKTKGMIDFKRITDVFIDHTQRSKRPQKLSFCIETMDKSYYLMAVKPELVTLWVDVIFTGAEGYLSLHHPSMLNSFHSNNNTVQ